MTDNAMSAGGPGRRAVRRDWIPAAMAVTVLLLPGAPSVGAQATGSTNPDSVAAAAAAAAASSATRAGAAGTTGVLPAESATVGARNPSADLCLRFTFGAWSPALDWRAAGHREPPSDSMGVPRPSGGRGYAAPVGVGADTVLMLLPTWWPAGVLVELPTRAPGLGDTLTGRAVALVADGRLEPPVSQVRAWRMACGSGGS